MQRWHSIRGYAAGAAALIVCPCHLPLVLPLLLTLTAGTAVGGWLAKNTALIYASATILFIGWLLLAIRWLHTAGANKTEMCQVKPGHKLN